MTDRNYELVPEDWIINAKTSVGHPNTLDEDTLVEIVYKSMDGEEWCKTGHAGNWRVMWKVDGFSPYITKYRVLE